MISALLSKPLSKLTFISPPNISPRILKGVVHEMIDSWVGVDLLGLPAFSVMW